MGRVCGENEHKGDGIDHQNANNPKKFAAVQQPHQTKQRHPPIITLRRQQGHGAELFVGRRGTKEHRSAGNHEAIALQTHIHQPLIGIILQRHFVPDAIALQPIEPILSQCKELLLWGEAKAFDLPIVGPRGQSAVKIFQTRARAVGHPNAVVAIDEHLSTPFQRAFQQSAVPFCIAIGGRKQTSAHIHRSKQSGMVEHQARQGKHDEEEGTNQAQPFVMLPPSGFFHFVFVDNVSVGAAVAVRKLN